MPKFRWGLLIIAALSGCSEPSGPGLEKVTLAPDREAYAPGETVSAELFNGSDIELGIGLCGLRVEQEVGSQWTLVGPFSLRCLDPMLGIGPGSRYVQTLRLDPDLAGGVYRLRQEIYPGTSLPTRFIRSPAFRLQAAEP